MGIETVAIASLISAAATTATAVDNHKTMEEQRKQYKQAQAESEAEKQKQEKKQKDLQSTYKNMKTNLYSGDVNGINSSQLIQ